MAKTYVVSRNIKDNEGNIIFKAGAQVSKDDALSYPKDTKIVETMFPTSEHSFDFAEEDVVKKEEVLDEVYNRKPKNTSSKKTVKGMK